jgi:hypothetical protein
MDPLRILNHVAACFGFADDHDSAMEEFYEEFEMAGDNDLCCDTELDPTICALLGVAVGILFHWQLAHFLKF